MVANCHRMVTVYVGCHVKCIISQAELQRCFKLIHSHTTSRRKHIKLINMSSGCAYDRHMTVWGMLSTTPTVREKGSL